MTALSKQQTKKASRWFAKVIFCKKEEEIISKKKSSLVNDIDSDSLHTDSEMEESPVDKKEGAKTVLGAFNHNNNTNHGGSKFIVGGSIKDAEFKAHYEPLILEKQSTLVLKTSFHLINIVLMGLCSVFDTLQKSK